MTPHNHDDISKRAYEIWEREGRPHGRDSEHWEQAARELGEEVASAAPSAQPASASDGASEPEPVKRGRGRAAMKGADSASPVSAKPGKPAKGSRKVKAVTSSSSAQPALVATPVELEVSKPDEPAKRRGPFSRKLSSKD
ncbi:DUF2934 domain-containing protein [Consotaella salsifontis]|uniref:DUF2934 domain-containing protein n=1 Tax=Consotaella salsifontis TaxID=1365950 RepID=A0A1T4T7N9_9HYPH|nr:DUF2934 domain-containing protein [Consotaella salsifontis]SKA36369.1 Protein of unknown function [Consotaella salsifontis]